MAEGEKKERAGVSVDISLGKGIDKSVGEILTSLLKPGATELGNLFGDGIGLISDKIRIKRELNAKLGLEQVRKKLPQADAELIEVTPPSTEELYLLIAGLSLADDINVRDLWAGLFAKSIEVNSKINAERSYISILQSLSPMDAKIIDLITFTVRTEREINVVTRQVLRPNIKPLTAEASAAIENAEAESRKLCEAAIRNVQELAVRHGLTSLSSVEWSGNLMRQGIIERSPPPGLPMFGMNSNSLDDMQRKIAGLSELAKWNSTAPKELLSNNNSAHLVLHTGTAILLQVRLTRFGKQFAEACGLL